MKPRKIVHTVLLLSTLGLTLIVLSGCSAKSSFVSEAQRLCQDNLGKYPEKSDTDEENSSASTSNLFPPALTLFRNSYKGSGKWTTMLLGPSSMYSGSKTEARTIVCINAERITKAEYRSGSKAYLINWTVQLISYPDGTLAQRLQFYDEGYKASAYKSDFSDTYSDPPDQSEITDWILSEMQASPGFLSGDQVRALDLSQDGKSLAKALSSQSMGTPALEIWDVTNETLTYRFNDIQVNKLVFSPNGKLLATTYTDTVRLFDMETFEEKEGIVTGDQLISSLVFSPDGKYLAAGFNSGPIQVWDVDSRNLAFTFEDDDEENYRLMQILFFPDGKKIACVGGGGFKVWDLDSGVNILSEFDGWEFAFSSDKLSISSDGMFLAYGSAKEGIVVFDTQTWEYIANYDTEFGKYDLYHVAFLPGSHILAGNVNNNLNFWDVTTLEKLGSVKIIPGKLMTFPDGQTLLIWGEDGIKFLNVGDYIEK
jgi:WD40 repeat protein